MNGTVRRRGKRSWELRFDLPRGADGKRRRQHVSVRGTKSDAQRRLRELLHQADTGLPLATSKETVGQFMIRWLDSPVVRTRKANTVKFYEMINRLYVNPVVGSVPIQRLTPADVEKVVGLVLAKGLSPTTARRVYATLHRALECALKWGVVYRNACDATDAPREAHHELDPPDRPTVKRLLERAMNGRHGAAFWLLAYTGMRRGEVCGVRRDDLDFERGVISIAGAVVRDNGSLEFVRPKSATSRRAIHIDVKTIAVLNTHLAQQAQERLVLGAAYHDEGFVFAPPTGRLLDPDVLTKTWQQICTDEEVTHTLRSLRHHHATALIEAGVHIKSVQARLGHSSPSLTMAVYSHVTPGMDEAAAEAYARAMSA